MTKLKIDYSESRDWYIKGDKDKGGIKYPSLPDIAREFEYSLSTLRKKAANEGWFKKREERIALKEIICKLLKKYLKLIYHLKLIQLNPASTLAISSTFTFIISYFLDKISSALSNPSGSSNLSFILRAFAAPSCPVGNSIK